MNPYGLDVDRLGELLKHVLVNSPARSACLATRPEYTLERLVFQAGDSWEEVISALEDAVLFVEEGQLQAGGVTIEQGQLIQVSPGVRLAMKGLPAAIAYLFRGAPQGLETVRTVSPTSDFRSKYWGSIETIVNEAYTGKRLFFRKGQHSSLHFHCAKTETYFIHSGRLLIRLRAGRGEDRFFELPAGFTLNIPPGLMHQSGALEDTVVMEISTHDEDSDSFLVEDGQRMPMPRLHALLAGTIDRPLKIVFDLDGCLCNQTDGDYEKAAPIAKAIELVNSLYDKGHEIIIHTSRFMGRSNGNPVAACNQGFAFTERQLRSWGVRYHLLVMGKPPADLVVDDRAVFFRPDWPHIAEEIASRIDPASALTSLPNAIGQTR